MASPFTAGCEEAYKAVFLDEHDTNWCWLGYQGNNLTPVGTGKGGIHEMLKKVDEAQILYGLLRLNKTDDGGDSKRVKFVFLTWVGEAAPAMKRGKVTIHKKSCAELFKGYHIEKQIYEKEELNTLEAEIDAMLKKAGGANYDLGNSRMGVQAGNSVNYKQESRDFFAKKEAETQIKNIVYTKDPLTKGVSACDLGNRAMTVGASDAKKNTVGYIS
jgi:hypothetical protein